MSAPPPSTVDGSINATFPLKLLLDLLSPGGSLNRLVTGTDPPSTSAQKPSDADGKKSTPDADKPIDLGELHKAWQKLQDGHKSEVEKLMAKLLKENKELKARVDKADLEGSLVQLGVRETMAELEKLKKERDGLLKAKAENSFAAAILDFEEDLFSPAEFHRADAGLHAARSLRDAMRASLPSEDTTSTFMVYLFLTRKKVLVRDLVAEGVVQDMAELDAFILAFNNAHPLYQIIETDCQHDVSLQRQRAWATVLARMPQCKRLILGRWAFDPILCDMLSPPKKKGGNDHGNANAGISDNAKTKGATRKLPEHVMFIPPLRQVSAAVVKRLPKIIRLDGLLRSEPMIRGRGALKRPTLDFNIPLYAQKPPVCLTQYLSPMRCPNEQCQFCHAYDLSEDVVQWMRDELLSTPCPHACDVGKCLLGEDACFFGHMCPFAEQCDLGGDCPFPEHMHYPAMEPTPPPFPTSAGEAPTMDPIVRASPRSTTEQVDAPIPAPPPIASPKVSSVPPAVVVANQSDDPPTSENIQSEKQKKSKASKAKPSAPVLPAVIVLEHSTNPVFTPPGSKSLPSPIVNPIANPLPAAPFSLPNQPILSPHSPRTTVVVHPGTPMIEGEAVARGSPAAAPAFNAVLEGSIALGSPSAVHDSVAPKVLEVLEAAPVAPAAAPHYPTKPMSPPLVPEVSMPNSSSPPAQDAPASFSPRQNQRASPPKPEKGSTASSPRQEKKTSPPKEEKESASSKASTPRNSKKLKASEAGTQNGDKVDTSASSPATNDVKSAKTTAELPKSPPTQAAADSQNESAGLIQPVSDVYGADEVRIPSAEEISDALQYARQAGASHDDLIAIEEDLIAGRDPFAGWQQYDENGQPYQYDIDEHGQPIYYEVDELGRPFGYDDYGHTVAHPDEVYHEAQERNVEPQAHGTKADQPGSSKTADKKDKKNKKKGLGIA